MDTDVLVVGAGPAGLTAAAFLAREGVRVLSIARHPGTANSPRAHITNQRTMEVLRDLGLEERVIAVGTSLARLNHNVMATSLTGLELARYRSYGSSPDRLSDYVAASPCWGQNAPQHVLEPVLLATAVEHGAEVRFSNELLAIDQDAEGVDARVRDRGTGEEYVVRARYAIGADGARSRVAEQLGIEFEGRSGLKHMMNMWLDVDLTRYVAHRPGVLYWVMQPGNDSWAGKGYFVCIRPFDEWIIISEYDPSRGEPDTSEAAVVAFARSLIGDADARITVKDVSRWQVNHLVADEYRRGRVLLAGDAAHRHPPTGGLGSNTSIQDSFNLAWKLALVLSGRAGEGLLDSYDQERRPVGRQIVDRAIKALENVSPINGALGFAPGQSPEEGWAALEELFSDAEGAERRRAELAAVIELQNYRSNAHGVELGQRYRSGAVVDDGTPFPEPTRDPALYYEPTTHPGGYLPHAWVEHERRRISTLDLVGQGRFTLIVGIGGEPWAQAAAEVGAELGIEMAVRSVGPRCEYDDVVGDWARVREIGDRGALLVRPDRHIAYRSHGRPVEPARALRSALREILHRGDESDTGPDVADRQALLADR